MAYKNLREFINLLEKGGQLARIKAPVDSHLEITEITDRVSKGPPEKNKALLFENVVGSDMPVLINMFGSPQRMAWALGVRELEGLNEKMAQFIDPSPSREAGPVLGRAKDMLGALRNAGMRPKMVKNASVQQVIKTGEAASLAGLPILTCWPEDNAPLITLPTVITRAPGTSRRNVGICQMQTYDDKTVGVRWRLPTDGRAQWRESGQERIPVAVSLGGDPAIIWASNAPLPPDMDEFLLAGWLRGKPVELVKCISQPLEVPANAEIVIEGWVAPHERRTEGPFGERTGYYAPPGDYPIMHVTAVTHRRDAIYPAKVSGPPPTEDTWMGKASERLFLPLLKQFQGEIVDWNRPASGVFHNLIFVSIKKRYPGQARKVINGLWGMDLTALTKSIVIFDEDVDVQDEQEALFHLFGNVDWSRDVIIQDGPVDALDYASRHVAFGGKIGIDATRKLSSEGYAREWPSPVSMNKEIKERVTRRWKMYGL